jgi:hypothetical protein
MIFNDRRNAKALKAANGPSLAPKGYKPDTAGRKVVKAAASPILEKNQNLVSNKSRYNAAATRVDRDGTANEMDPWTSKNDSVRRK